MPRKQRFKPSRKPKPSPQSEAATIGHDGRNTSSQVVHNDNVDVTGGSPRMDDEDSGLKPDADQRSR
jgi:hypothetical protein